MQQRHRRQRPPPPPLDAALLAAFAEQTSLSVAELYASQGDLDALFEEFSTRLADRASLRATIVRQHREERAAALHDKAEFKAWERDLPELLDATLCGRATRRALRRCCSPAAMPTTRTRWTRWG